MPLIPAWRRRRQPISEFENTLVYIVSFRSVKPWLSKKKVILLLWDKQLSNEVKELKWLERNDVELPEMSTSSVWKARKNWLVKEKYDRKLSIQQITQCYMSLKQRHPIIDNNLWRIFQTTRREDSEGSQWWVTSRWKWELPWLNCCRL